MEFLDSANCLDQVPAIVISAQTFTSGVSTMSGIDLLVLIFA